MNLQQLNSKLEKMEAVLKANEEQIAVLNEQNGILKSNISEVKKLQKKYESIEVDLEKKIESLNLMDLDLKPKRRTKPKRALACLSACSAARISGRLSNTSELKPAGSLVILNCLLKGKPAGKSSGKG